MNILYICHRIPYPPNKGDKIRSFHQVKHLARKHKLHLACMVDEREDLDYVKSLQEYCVSVDVAYRDKKVARILALLAFVSGKPMSVAAFYSKELQAKIDTRLSSEKFDRVIVFSSAMAKYVMNVSDVPKMMDFVDVDPEKWRMYAAFHSFPLSSVYRLEAKRLESYERKVAKKFDQSIFVSEKEAELFRRGMKDCPIAVIPNGVDLDYFKCKQEARPFTPPPVMVFVGAMDYFPNADAVRFFCNDIFPSIVRKMPNAKFYIVGRNPTGQVRELHRPPHVIVTGSVGDIRPYLIEASVAVAPFHIARGVQNKILEAMAMGLPVVGTSVAFQGIAVTDADGTQRADGPLEFRKSVLEYLEKPALWQQASQQARRYVEERHHWKDHYLLLDALLEKGATEVPLPVQNRV